MLRFTIILVFFMKLTMNCVIDHRSKDTIVEQRLHKDLLKDYQAHKPPCTNTTTVHLRYVLKYFFFDKNEDNFYVNNWAFITWIDSRLAWKEEDYDNLEETLMVAILIWRPQASFNNMNGLNDDNEYTKPSNLCKVRSTGVVSCSLKQYHRTNCKTNLNNWPYDVQYCSFKLISDQATQIQYKHHKIVYSLAFEDGMVRLKTVSYGPGWNIVNTKSGIVKVNGSTFQFDFSIQRQALGFATIIIIPSIVMAILTISSMFLDVRCYVRIVVLSLSLVSHLSLLEFISVFLPHHDYDTPSILRFISASIFVTTSAIILSVTLNLLLNKRAKSVRNVVSFNKRVLETRFKYFAFPKWKVDSNEGTEDENVAGIWIDFASIVNSLFLYTFFVVYLITYCVFMPQPTYFTY